VTFQRARSAEQREERRRAILETAAAMLAETSVADLTLTALARRARLAKSAVLRYFDSREAVLLDLLVREWADWLAALTDLLDAAADPVDALVDTLVVRPTLCDLLAAQAVVLERNVSPEVAAGFKRTTVENTRTLGVLLRRAVPELTEENAFRFAGSVGLVVGALWSHCQPSDAMLAAYAADPGLSALRLDFPDVLRELLTVLLRGFR
jgi:AcrR family transcriptional regulator